MTTALAAIARALPGRGISLRLGGAARLWFVVAAITVAATLLYLLDVHSLPIPEGRHLPWWALVPVFYAAEAYVIHVHFRREAHTLSLNEFALVIGLFFVSPSGLLLAQLVGAGAALVFFRRQRPLKVGFNLAQFALSTLVAILVFHTLVDHRGRVGPTDWLGTFAATGAGSMVSVLLVALAISMAEGRLRAHALGRVGVLAFGGSLVNASLALAAIRLTQADPITVCLLVLPCLGSVLSYRAYIERRRRHEHLEFLYDSMRTIQAAPDADAAVGRMLGAACTLLRAEFAEVVLLSRDDDHRAVRSSVGRQGSRLMQADALGAAEQRALEIAAEETGAMLVSRGGRGTEFDAYVEERGLGDAILIGLRNEDRVFGLLIVADRAGDVETFGEHECRLLETFASHVSVLLENDRLEQSLAEGKVLRAKLRHQAYHDTLTGLPNRALLTERVTRAVEGPRSENVRPAVLFLDLDDFKAVNDSLGHAAGDELLQLVAERVRGCVGPGQIPARLGGDEFAVLLAKADLAEAKQLAERLVDALHRPIVLEGRELSLHGSVGIAFADETIHTADELLQNADLAMYSAKANGKRRYALYEPEMHGAVRRRNELFLELEHAVETGQIIPHYQPIVSLKDGRPVVLEALARWEHPDRGMIQPNEFIPLAEDTGLMIPLGRALLRRVCLQLKEWEGEFGLGGVAIAVNLAPSELQNALLFDEVSAIFAETGADPSRFIFEITESGAMRDPQATIETMLSLKQLGVRFALDDFGTGYSSLSHVRDFPLDLIKIAKPFVDRLDRSLVDVSFIEIILRLADSLGLEAVAEGIEHPMQAKRLEALGCGLGQGYWFARPLAPADAGAYLVKQLYTAAA